MDMKFPKFSNERSLHETDTKAMSDDFEKRSDSLASTLVDTNRKLDALSALLANFEPGSQKDEVVPGPVTGARVIERMDIIERRVNNVEVLLCSIFAEVKAMRRRGDPPQTTGYPVYPGTNVPIPGTGVPMPRTNDPPMPNPYCRVTCGTDKGPSTTATPPTCVYTNSPEMFKNIRVENYIGRRENDPACENHEDRYVKFREGDLSEPVPIEDEKEEKEVRE